MTNLEIFICIALIVLILVISIFLLMGKGSFLIAGYNLLSKEEKEKFNKSKLCRVVGIEGVVISLILVICTYYKFDLPSYFEWIMPWGLFGSIIVTLILTNTICKK